MLFSKKVPEQDLEYDEYSHGPVYRFFRGYSTYFIKLMSVNLLFVICNIPAMLVAFAYCLIFLPNFNEVFIPENFINYVTELGLIGNPNINDIGNEAGFELYYIIVLFCVMFLLGTTLICVGPFQSGFDTIYKNIARGNGVFIFNDFKDGIKKNWKQSLKNTVVSLIISAIIMFSIGFYANHFDSVGTTVSVFFLVLLCAFVIIQNVVNYLIVTIDLPLGKLYKNAILFLFIKLFTYVLLLALTVVMLLVIPVALLLTATWFGYAIAVIYYLTLAFIFPQYAFAFFTNEMVDLYILPKTKKVQDALKAKAENIESDEDDDESDEDEADDDDEDEDEDDEGEEPDSSETSEEEEDNNK
ncbi:MAG: DUF624 domain-containing protein [Clostridia bacterium]|nr:DUF624 domain-containing protein [Clostridia bacterium]